MLWFVLLKTNIHTEVSLTGPFFFLTKINNDKIRMEIHKVSLEGALNTGAQT